MSSQLKKKVGRPYKNRKGRKVNTRGSLILSQTITTTKSINIEISNIAKHILSVQENDKVISEHKFEIIKDSKLKVELKELVKIYEELLNIDKLKKKITLSNFNFGHSGVDKDLKETIYNLGSELNASDYSGLKSNIPNINFFEERLFSGYVTNNFKYKLKELKTKFEEIVSKEIVTKEYEEYKKVKEKAEKEAKKANNNKKKYDNKCSGRKIPKIKSDNCFRLLKMVEFLFHNIEKKIPHLHNYLNNEKIHEDTIRKNNTPKHEINSVPPPVFQSTIKYLQTPVIDHPYKVDDTNYENSEYYIPRLHNWNGDNLFLTLNERSKLNKVQKGKHFEQLCKKIMPNLLLIQPERILKIENYNGKDGGIDIRLEVQNNTTKSLYIAQCKCHQTKIGVPAIKQFAQNINENGANQGYFFSASEFTKDAYDYVKKIHPFKIKLINGKTLFESMKKQNWYNAIKIQSIFRKKIVLNKIKKKQIQQQMQQQKKKKILYHNRVYFI
jgi:hypothetical protein